MLLWTMLFVCLLFHSFHYFFIGISLTSFNLCNTNFNIFFMSIRDFKNFIRGFKFNNIQQGLQQIIANAGFSLSIGYNLSLSICSIILSAFSFDFAVDIIHSFQLIRKR